MAKADIPELWDKMKSSAGDMADRVKGTADGLVKAAQEKVTKKSETEGKKNKALPKGKVT